jgi:tetratricopeptide (TPR) repeat protein
MSIEKDARAFLSVLAEAHLSRSSGIVRVTDGDARLAVALQAGKVVALEAEVSADAAGSAEDRELAALLAEAFTGGEPALSRAAARQTLLEGLRSLRAQAVFEAGASESADPPLEFPTEELLREAAHLADALVVDAALGDLDRPLVAAVDPRELQEKSLTPSEGYLLSRLDGSLTARGVLALLPFEAEAARRSLLGLLVGGFVRFASPTPKPSAAHPAGKDVSPPPDPEMAAREARRRSIMEAHARIVGERNHFAVLGLTRDATEAEVKAAYFGFAKLFHPDTLGELSDLHATVEAIFTRLGTAYQVLSQPKSRAAYEEMLPKRPAAPIADPVHAPRRPPPSVPGAPLPTPDVKVPTAEDLAWIAEENLRRGEELLSEGKFWEVIQALEGHVDALTGRLRGRGRLILAQAYLHNPKWLHRGEEQLRMATKEDPQNAEAYYLLGTIYKTGGLRTRAASMFRRALEVRPAHRAAADELAALEKAPPPPRRWFKSTRSEDES